jgi:ribosomal protein S27AE
MMNKIHYPASAETHAFTCARCGAVALDANNICKVLGIEKREDWCGSKGMAPPEDCYTKLYTDRWQCQKCGQTAVNSELLCEPEKMDFST